jgi:hypothetical protein
MRITIRERLSRAWQPVSNFLLMLDSGGAAGGFEELHARLEAMNQRLNRLEASIPQHSTVPQSNRLTPVDYHL